MSDIISALVGLLVFSFFYSWLERWLGTGDRALKIRTLEPLGREWHGLGIPYHIPIMLFLFLCMVITPLWSRLVTDLSYILIVIANLFLAFLVEDFIVQMFEYCAGEGWITDRDWSCQWGSIPLYGDYVLPVWYPLYMGIVIVLYYLW